MANENRNPEIERQHSRGDGERTEQILTSDQNGKSEPVVKESVPIDDAVNEKHQKKPDQEQNNAVDKKRGDCE